MKTLPIFLICLFFTYSAYAQPIMHYPISLDLSIEGGILLPLSRKMDAYAQKNVFCVSDPKTESKHVHCKNPADNLMAKIRYSIHTLTTSIGFSSFERLNPKKYKGNPIGGGGFYVVPREYLAKKIKTKKIMWVSFSFVYPTDTCAWHTRYYDKPFIFPFQAGKRVEYIFDECFNHTVKVTDLPKEAIKWEYFDTYRPEKD